MTLPIGAPEIESLTYKPLTTQEASTPVFTITCTSTGGPACLNCHLDKRLYTSTQWYQPLTVSDLILDCDTGTYQSVLTVTGPDYGEYKCQQQRKCCQYRLYHHCSWYVTQWKHSMYKLQCMMQQHSIYLHNHWYNLFVRMWHEWIYCWIFFRHILATFQTPVLHSALNFWLWSYWAWHSITTLVDWMFLSCRPSSAIA